jgi:nitroreductase
VDLFDLIKARRSIRKYKPGTIPKEKLGKILEAARQAPSAGNRQPWRFVIVTDWERKQELAKAANNQMFIADAGAIVAVLGIREISERWFNKDPMIATEHMVLAATALGYGSCWIGAFNEEKVKQLLKIPDDVDLVAILPIGVPAETSGGRTRKEIHEIFFEEEYNRPLKWE